MPGVQATKGELFHSPLGIHIITLLRTSHFTPCKDLQQVTALLGLVLLLLPPSEDSKGRMLLGPMKYNQQLRLQHNRQEQATNTFR